LNEEGATGGATNNGYLTRTWTLNAAILESGALGTDAAPFLSKSQGGTRTRLAAWEAR